MKAIYPWETWLSRRRFELERGKHYTCGQSTMAQQLRNAASRMGVRIKIQEHETGLTVSVLGARHGS